MKRFLWYALPSWNLYFNIIERCFKYNFWHYKMILLLKDVNSKIGHFIDGFPLYSTFHEYVIHWCLFLTIKEDVYCFPKAQSSTRLWVVFIQHEDPQVDLDSLFCDNDDRKLWFHADVLQATSAQWANGLWRREGKNNHLYFISHLYNFNYRNRKSNLLDQWKDVLCPSRPFGLWVAST